MVNLSSPKTFSFVEFILEKKSFTQYSAVKELKLSMPLVNQVTNFLLDKGFLSHDGKKYVLRDAAGLVSAVHLFRDMRKALLVEVSTSLGKEEVVKLLPSAAIFCLDSALAHYSNWWRSNKACAYVTEKEALGIQKKLFYKKGGKTIVRLFLEQPLVKDKVKFQGRQFTSKIRTVIDMVCDNQMNAVEPLFSELWGERIGRH
ncbi:MAG: hypothetical protein V1494_05970 [Candidatus Diapherotrites archaeon]